MKNTTITTPGKTRTISQMDPLIDVICEHTGWNPDLLDDPRPESAKSVRRHPIPHGARTASMRATGCANTST